VPFTLFSHKADKRAISQLTLKKPNQNNNKKPAAETSVHARQLNILKKIKHWKGKIKEKNKETSYITTKSNNTVSRGY